MASYNVYKDLAQEIASTLIVEDINEMVQFLADKAGLAMLRLMGGTIPSGKPGVGFKTQEPMIKKRAISSYQPKWITQAVADKDCVVNGAISDAVTTTIAVTAGTYANGAENGIYQVEHPTTGALLETIYLKELAGTPNFTVVRNIGSTSNASIPDASILRRRSHSVSDYSSTQKIHDIDPTVVSNLSESIRVDWEITLKAAAMREYGDLNDPTVIKRRKLYEFSKYLNHALLFGKGGTTTDKDGKRVQFMKGLTSLMTTHIYGANSATGFTEGHGGDLTFNEYRNTFLRTITRYLPDDTTDVIVLHGSMLEQAIDYWFEQKISNVSQDESVLGWTVTKIKVNGKTFHHLYDATVDEQDAGMAIVFPKDSVTYLYTSHNGINLDMKHYETKPMNQGGTKVGGFYLVDCSVELGWEQGTGYMSGVTSYS